MLAGVVQGDRGQIGQRDQPADVTGAEGRFPAPPHLEDTDHLAVDDQRRTEGGAGLLGPGQVVEIVGDDVIAQVVVHLRGLAGGEDMAGQSLPPAHPQVAGIRELIPRTGPHHDLVALAQHHAGDVGVQQTERLVRDSQQRLVQFPGPQDPGGHRSQRLDLGGRPLTARQSLHLRPAGPR